jgi:predicted phosphoribosyltransferase
MIDELALPVHEELQARNHIFREDRPWSDVRGRTVIIVDDGLASGYTMMTTARMVQRRPPSWVVVVVPTASARTIELLAPDVDLIVAITCEPNTALQSMMLIKIGAIRIDIKS